MFYKLSYFIISLFQRIFKGVIPLQKSPKLLLSGGGLNHFNKVPNPLGGWGVISILD